MYPLRRFLLACCALLGTFAAASSQPQLSDSLQRVLAQTDDPVRRVQLLLNLKDLNEDSGLNLPYSIQLFAEAAPLGDTYALSVAAIPIIGRYAPYPEKEDTLRHYLRTIRALTPGTPEEGLTAYAEMAGRFYRLRNVVRSKSDLDEADRALAWCDSLAALPARTCCDRAAELTVRGYAELLKDYYERRLPDAMKHHADVWKQAYDAAGEIGSLNIRRMYGEIIYYLLSGAYNQGLRYDDQVKLTEDFVATLDAYYADDRRRGRRPYLYADNSYVRPYRQLIRGALNIGRDDLAGRHFDDLRRRMLHATGENLVRNKTYLYETGYQVKALFGDYDRALMYNDSLIGLIARRQGYYRMKPAKLYHIYHERSIMLTNAGRYDDAFAAFEHTARLQDSVFTAERLERSRTLRNRREMDRRKLAETRSVIRNRTTVILSFIALALLLVGTGIRFFRMWLRNRRLQRDIQLHSRKSQESEHMKSIFVNTICRGIGPPLDGIDRAAHALMIAGLHAPERSRHLETIRESTETLLSTLDNMLEAANLDSLTGHLVPEAVDVDEICRAELLAAARLRHNDLVDFRIEAPDTPCIVHTHPKYFTFVVRALIDNAGKYTRVGSVVLRYEPDSARNELRITVTDTGCGIPPERSETIFRTVKDAGEGSRGMSLPLCRVIVGRLSGSLRLDTEYGPGARFVFTIPCQP